MGADSFVVTSHGKTAKEAFRVAVEDALYEYGHRGYTGSVAEKHDFVMIDCPKDRKPVEYAWDLVGEGDRRIDDKWGPAGCIKCGNDTWVFFGVASS